MFFKKNILLILLVLIIFSGCSDINKSGKSNPENSQATLTSSQITLISPTETNENDEQFMFYTTNRGLFESNLDGSNKKLMDDIEYGYYIGEINNFIYYDNGNLYKIDIKGEQKQQLTTMDIDDSIMLNDIIYFVSSNKLYMIESDGSIEVLDSIPGKLRNFDMDGDKLYLCIIVGGDSCDLYEYNIIEKKFKQILQGLSIEPIFDIKDGIIYFINRTSEKSYIIYYNIKTGEKKNLLEYDNDELLISINNFQDWLLYTTNKFDINYIYGFNIKSGKTFKVTSPGEIINQILPNQVLIYNYKTDLMSRLIINGDVPKIESLIN